MPKNKTVSDNMLRVGLTTLYACHKAGCTGEQTVTEIYVNMKSVAQEESFNLGGLAWLIVSMIGVLLITLPYFWYKYHT